MTIFAWLAQHPDVRFILTHVAAALIAGFLAGTWIVTWSFPSLPLGGWKRVLAYGFFGSLFVRGLGQVIPCAIFTVGILIPIAFMDDGSFDERGTAIWREKQRRDEEERTKNPPPPDDEDGLF